MNIKVTNDEFKNLLKSFDITEDQQFEIGGGSNVTLGYNGEEFYIYVWNGIDEELNINITK